MSDALYELGATIRKQRAAKGLPMELTKEERMMRRRQAGKHTSTTTPRTGSKTMQADMTIPTNPALAADLIKQWKSDPALRDQYANNAASFFIEEEWKRDPAIREEFGNDFAAYAALAKRGG